MDALALVALVSRWLHLLAVAAAVGGAIFARFVLAPAVDETLDDDQRDGLHAAVRRRWQIWVHGCIAVLLVTGGINLWRAMAGKPPASYMIVFGVKFALVLGVFLIAIMLTSRRAYLPTRRAAARAGTVLVVLAVAIILLSGVLRTLSLGA